MNSTEKENALYRKYENDPVMSLLLSCNHDIVCINHILRNVCNVSLTLEEIGLVLGVTRERVRQIESTALKKLKSPKIGRALRGYMEI